MKQTTNMSRVIGELQTIARKLNKDWFNNVLDMDRVVITVQSSPRAHGSFTPYLSYRVHDVNGERGAVEINIGAGTLDRPIEFVVSTLIHELTHYLNWCNGVKDVSGAYHNRKFRDEAERHGITIEYDSRIGWSITSPTEELLNWCIDNNLEDFRLGRNEWNGYFVGGTATGSARTATPPLPKKSNSHKLICPICRTTVRYTTAKRPNIICGDCTEIMIDA